MADANTDAKNAKDAAPPEGAAPEGDAAAAAAAGAKKRKMMLIISGALALVGILVAVGVVFMMGSGDKPSDEAHDQTATPAMAMVDVPEFSVNLLTDEGTSGPRFMKIKLAIELEKAADAAALEKMMPRLQDDWLGFLRQMRASDMQGSAAVQQLKEGLLRRASQALDPLPIKAVYIREMLIQ